MLDSFTSYCSAVCALVRFKPDREAIAEELTSHMEDHMAALEEAGVPHEEAKRRAIQSMGDPEALGRALDAQHNPLLGWLQLWMWRVSRLAAAVLLPLSLLLSVGPFRSGWEDLQGAAARYEHLTEGAAVVAQLQPDASCRTEGYAITLPRAQVVRQADGELWVRFLLRAGHLNPWLRRPDFAAVSARDDLGGHYSSGELSAAAGEVILNRAASTPFATYYEGRIYPLDPEADGITLFCAPYGETVFSLTFSLEEADADD